MNNTTERYSLTKHTRCNFTQISNATIVDNNLKDSSHRLLCYYLSKPDDWKFYLTAAQRELRWGETKRKSAWQGIEAAGYGKRTRTRTNDGSWVYAYHIADYPKYGKNGDSSKLSQGTVSVHGSSVVENPTLTNTVLTNTDECNTNDNTPIDQKVETIEIDDNRTAIVKETIAIEKSKYQYLEDDEGDHWIYTVSSRGADMLFSNFSSHRTWENWKDKIRKGRQQLRLDPYFDWSKFNILTRPRAAYSWKDVSYILHTFITKEYTNQSGT